MSDKKLIKSLKTYYLPQLKFSMEAHRRFAEKYAKHNDVASHHHGCANGLETAIGCIEEAIKDSKK